MLDNYCTAEWAQLTTFFLLIEIVTTLASFIKIILLFLVLVPSAAAAFKDQCVCILHFLCSCEYINILSTYDWLIGLLCSNLYIIILLTYGICIILYYNSNIYLIHYTFHMTTIHMET